MKIEIEAKDKKGVKDILLAVTLVIDDFYKMRKAVEEVVVVGKNRAIIKK